MKKEIKKQTGQKQLCALVMAFISVMVISGCNPYHCDNLPESLRNLETSTHYMFILWRPAAQPFETFRTAFFNDIAPKLLERSPQRLAVWMAAPEIKSMTLINRPRKDGAIVSAIVSATVESPDAANDFAGILKSGVVFVAGYEVKRAIPLDYQRTWPDGEPSPGVVQVTFLRQKAGMTPEAFRNYWFCSHTPYALKIHPLFRYERNEVVKPITADAPDFNGIVGLYLREVKDMTKLNRFFGGNILVNAPRIGIDVNKFIDMKRVEVTAMTEYILKGGDAGKN